MPGAWVRHNPGRFVDDQAGSIFEENVQRLHLPVEHHGRRLRGVEVDDVTRLKFPTWFGDSMVDAHPPGFDHSLQGRARQLWFTMNQK